MVASKRKPLELGLSGPDYTTTTASMISGFNIFNPRRRNDRMPLNENVRGTEVPTFLSFKIKKFALYSFFMLLLF